ncbi:MAG: phage portal protein, partial [Phycisphaerae bacterium]|nr:phage portal protein [Phycisphaerae bacterium]
MARKAATKRVRAKAKPEVRTVVVAESQLSKLILRARYDAAQTNTENRRHWAAADSLGPDAAGSSGVRRTLRIRSRHEVANNSYLAGAVLSLANDIVGTGPRLRVLLADREVARRIEASFTQWARAVRLAGKLQTMVKARVRDGEAFAIKTNNPRLRTAVLLDFRLIEADMVCSPMGRQDSPLFVDGIEYDEAWNPVTYHVLDQHPGEACGQPETRPYDARNVLHTYREDRPGQSRGIPELTPALGLSAMLRELTLATLRAAGHAADYAAVMQTTLPTVEAADLYGDDSVEIERGTIAAMPEGWELKQFDAKHPNTTYASFKGELLDEIGRALQMPANVIRGNSAGYNYASGRLDHQVYRRMITVYRDDLDRSVLDELLASWVEEASLLPGLLPRELRDMLELPHTWLWPGFFHVDPTKEATAQAQRIENSTTTLAAECAMSEQPSDWEDVLEQRGRELARMRELGIPTSS